MKTHTVQPLQQHLKPKKVLHPQVVLVEQQLEAYRRYCRHLAAAPVAVQQAIILPGPFSPVCEVSA